MTSLVIISGLSGSGKSTAMNVLEDLGYIPSLSDWLREMPAQPWMAGARKLPIKIVD